MNVDATKIKVGDQIKFRNGKIETVSEFKYNPDPVDTYSCEVTFESGCRIDYTTGGKFWDDGDGDGRDIMYIIPAETSKETPIDATKIKVGDKVRLRNGDVKIVTNVDLKECSTYPVEVCLERVMIYAYTRDGFYWDAFDDDKDIVEITPAETSEETSIDATKIKAGDKIRFRNGDVLTVCDISFNANSVYPVVIHWDEGRQYDGCGWTGYGRFCTHAETDLDIVEIIPAETSIDATKIKVGDKIRLRNGEVHTVTEVNLLDHPTYPVEVCWVDRGNIYTRDGVYLEGDEDDRDIVEIIPAETSEKPAQDEMTLRDQFAMAALSALLQGASTKAAEESIAKDAYFFADKMMQARKENN